MPKIAFYTLGCKANQYETSVIARDAFAAGLQVVDFACPADIYIINTCTVTANADRKSRNAIKLAKKRNPRAKVIATGCLAEVFPDEIRKLQSADLIIKNSEKENIVKRILPRDGRREVRDGIAPARIRENLLIEDGCRQMCSYCIVPYARGKVKSKPAEEIIKEAKELVNSGARELVLTGINLGAYGTDDRRSTLPHIIDEISKIDSLLRIRLSSIEPLFITEELIASIVSHPKVCKHLHVPLQSGDDGILKAMNRKYSSKDYAAIIGKIRRVMPDMALNTDIIAGFPGENEKAFNNTLKLIQELRFSRIHAFHFSVRPGTPAAKFPDQVPSKVIRKRIDLLQKLRVKIMRDFASREAKRSRTVLIESFNKKIGLLEGLTESYVRVLLKGDARLIGKLVGVRITDIRDEFVKGKFRNLRMNFAVPSNLI